MTLSHVHSYQLYSMDPLLLWPLLWRLARLRDLPCQDIHILIHETFISCSNENSCLTPVDWSWAAMDSRHTLSNLGSSLNILDMSVSVTLKWETVDLYWEPLALQILAATMEIGPLSPYYKSHLLHNLKNATIWNLNNVTVHSCPPHLWALHRQGTPYGNCNWKAPLALWPHPIQVTLSEYRDTKEGESEINLHCWKNAIASHSFKNSLKRLRYTLNTQLHRGRFWSKTKNSFQILTSRSKFTVAIYRCRPILLVFWLLLGRLAHFLVILTSTILILFTK